MQTKAIKGGPGARHVYLDCVKVLAILLVLFIHSGSRGSRLFESLEGSWLYWPALANGIFSWAAVPLFFMVSGALLLGREASVAADLRRFGRFLIVLILASALQYWYIFRYEPGRMYLAYLVQVTYSDYMVDTYWFLYSYLGLLLTLPLLRRLAGAMGDGDFLYLLAIYALFKLAHALELLVWQGAYTLNRSLVVFIAGDSVFYPLLGYWLHRRAPESLFTRRNALLLLAGGLLALGLSSLLVRYALRLGADDPGSYYHCFLYVPIIAVFFAIRTLFLLHPPGERAARVLGVFAECSFGVYLFEGFCKRPLLPIYTALAPYIGRLAACWLWILASFLLGSAAVFLLKHIPGLRRLL